MIAHVMIGTNDIVRATQFYDSLLAEVDAKLLLSWERVRFWGTNLESPLLGVCIPYDGNPQQCGNGNMVGISVDSTAIVDKVYAKALSLGASDEGPPGERMPSFYAAYIRDLDANKLCFFVKPTMDAFTAESG